MTGAGSEATSGLRERLEAALWGRSVADCSLTTSEAVYLTAAIWPLVVAAVEQAEKDKDELRDALKAIAAMHYPEKPFAHREEAACWQCSGNIAANEWIVPYPCPTRQFVDAALARSAGGTDG